jgi:purine-binding chemotaxis protein CheW
MSEADILRARARSLARRPAIEGADAPGTSVEVLEFRLGSDRYAIEVRHVRGVHPLRNMTPLPCTPPFVLGIVSVRGRMLPVISLKRFFDLPDGGLTDLHRVVMVRHGDMEFGLPADIDVVVRRIEPAHLQSPPVILDPDIARCVAGITTDGLAVLDIPSLCADPRLVVDDEFPRVSAVGPSTEQIKEDSA